MEPRLKLRRPVDFSVLQRNKKDTPISWRFSDEPVDASKVCESAISTRCSRGEIKRVSLEYADGRCSSVFYCDDCFVAHEKHWRLKNVDRFNYIHAEQLIRKQSFVS